MTLDILQKIRNVNSKKANSIHALLCLYETTMIFIILDYYDAIVVNNKDCQKYINVSKLITDDDLIKFCNFVDKNNKVEAFKLIASLFMQILTYSGFSEKEIQQQVELLADLLKDKINDLQPIDNENAIYNGSFETNFVPTILKFREQLTAAFNEKIKLFPDSNIKSTKFSKNPCTYLVTSKANRLQNLISNEFDSGLGIAVGSNVTINARIQTPDHKAITPFERELQEAIGSLIQTAKNENKDDNGSVILSIVQIYKELTGISPKAGIRPERLQELEETIDRLRFSKTTIDFVEQAEKHKNLNINKADAYIDDYALSATKLKDNKSNTVYYKFNSFPVFYLYSKMIKQITKVDKVLLNESNTTAPRHNTEDYIVIKRTIIKNIEYMKHELKTTGSYEGKRSFNTIFKEALGTEELKPKKARTTKEDIEHFLNSLKEQKYIKDFQKYKKNRAFAGVEIFI